MDDFDRFYFIVKEVIGGGNCSPDHYFVAHNGKHIPNRYPVFTKLKELKDIEQIPLLLKEKFVPLELACLDACARILKNALNVPGLKIIIRKEGGPDRIIVYGMNEGALSIEVERLEDRYILLSSSADGLFRSEKDIRSEQEYFNITKEKSRTSLTPSNNNTNDKQGSVPKIEILTGSLKQGCFLSSLKNLLNLEMNLEEFQTLVANRIVDDIMLDLELKPKDYTVEEDSKFVSCKINEEVELATPYESDSWTFNSETDIDLRTQDDLSIENLHEQRVKAFNMCLGKINKYLKQASVACPTVDPSFFEPYMFDTILLRGHHGSTILGLFPTAMKRTFEVFKAETKHIKLDLRYTVEISLHNPLPKHDILGPCGPHVRYTIIHECSSPTTAVGFILLNLEGNEYLPDFHRSRKYEYSHKCPVVPTTRLFSMPSSSKCYLQRGENTQNVIKNRRYPSWEF